MPSDPEQRRQAQRDAAARGERGPFKERLGARKPKKDESGVSTSAAPPPSSASSSTRSTPSQALQALALQSVTTVEQIALALAKSQAALLGQQQDQKDIQSATSQTPTPASQVANSGDDDDDDDDDASSSSSSSSSTSKSNLRAKIRRLEDDLSCEVKMRRAAEMQEEMYEDALRLWEHEHKDFLEDRKAYFEKHGNTP